MVTRCKRIMTVVIAAVVLVLIALMSLLPVQAAPPAAPTPVAGVNQGDLARVMNFMLAQVIVTNTRVCQIAGVHEFADIQYVIDQNAAATNTITLTLQYSNEQSHFTDGPDLVAGNTADADSLAQYAVFGQYACIYATVANTNPVTATVIGLGK